MAINTVKDALRASGFTQEQIDAFDARALGVFDGVMTAAESAKAAAEAAQAKADADFKAASEAVTKAEAERAAATAAREAAELQGRSNVDYYEQTIVPSLTGWDAEKAALQAERTKAAAEAAFYRTQAEGARAGGFIPADAPGYKPEEQGRGADGKYEAGKGGTPGSPQFTVNTDELYKRVDTGLGVVNDIAWRHQSLYGQPLPISPSQLIKEADAQKLDPATYADRRFKFRERETELSAERQRAHEAKLTADAAAARDAEWDAKMKAREAEYAAKDKQRAEQSGNNPDVRTPVNANFTEVKKAVEAGTRPDPLKMTDQQRRAATRNAIHSEIQEREGAVA